MSFLRSRWAPLAVLMVATWVYVLDFFVINVALPAMQRDLGASASSLEWVVAGYSLSTAAFLIVAGRLGDHFGRRRLFRIGLAVFVLSSAGCALAPDPTVLVIARLAQGVGSAAMAPNVLSILGVIYVGPDRARAISIYGMVMGLAAASGQLLGALLIDADPAGLGWRSIFWVNVPVGVAGWLLAPRLVPESRHERGGRIDVVGAAIVTAGLVAVILPLVDGRQAGWPAWSWACLAVAPLVLAAFAAYQRRLEGVGRAPLLAPALFRSAALRAGLGTQIVFWCQQAASYLILALYLQEVRGLGPLASGGMFTILVAGYLLTSFRAPALTERLGPAIITLGTVVAAIGDLLLLAGVVAGDPGTTVAVLAPGLLILGAGQGLCITPLTSTMLAHADADTAGSVSGALSTMQQVGNAVGVAVTGVLFFGAARGTVGFERSLVELAAVLGAVCLLSLRWQRIVRGASTSRVTAAEATAAAGPGV
ncbi:MAG TPA: MFS transporter [Acidimicrobiales bacterium]|nr:MFS transporter [Acidimicrobiales bacterium]